MKFLRQIKYQTEIKWIIKRFVFINLIVLTIFAIIKTHDVRRIRLTGVHINESKMWTNYTLNGSSTKHSHELYEKFRNETTNLPIESFEKYYNETKKYSCAPYPNILDLKYVNTYWQRFIPDKGNPNITIDILNAYFDDRPKLQHPVVRIISAINVEKPEFNFYCQMWFKEQPNAKTTKVHSFTMLWDQEYIKTGDGIYIGFIVTCPLPDMAKQAPLAISLVRKKCDRAVNNLKVQNHRPVDGIKKDFLVCVKGLDFPIDDVSLQLIQFFEVNFMFGVDKIILYDYQINENGRKVIDYYKILGKIEFLPLTLPGFYPNHPYLRHLMWYKRELNSMLNEVIPYNDCFYRNMYLYNYILLLDTDEVFVPMHGTSYKEMLEQIPQNIEQASAIYSHNRMFVRNTNEGIHLNLSEDLFMTQIITIATNYNKKLKRNPKSFHNTQTALALNNHLPYKCLGECWFLEIPRSVGQLNHYRPGQLSGGTLRCFSGFHVVNDMSLLKYKNKLINATNKVLNYMHQK